MAAITSIGMTLFTDGEICLVRGVYGSGQERIILPHPGGPPSAPPIAGGMVQHQQPSQLSPVFLMPNSPPQVMRNLCTQPQQAPTKGSSPSLPSFGSLGSPSNNGLRSPLLGEKVVRTPLPIIGGKLLYYSPWPKKGPRPFYHGQIISVWGRHHRHVRVFCGCVICVESVQNPKGHS